MRSQGSSKKPQSSRKSKPTATKRTSTKPAGSKDAARSVIDSNTSSSAQTSSKIGKNSKRENKTQDEASQVRSAFEEVFSAPVSLTHDYFVKYNHQTKSELKKDAKAKGKAKTDAEAPQHEEDEDMKQTAESMSDADDTSASDGEENASGDDLSQGDAGDFEEAGGELESRTSARSVCIREMSAVEGLLESKDMRILSAICSSCIRGSLNLTVSGELSFKTDKLVTKKGQSDDQRMTRLNAKLLHLKSRAAYDFQALNLVDIFVMASTKIEELLLSSTAAKSPQHFGSKLTTLATDLATLLASSGPRSDTVRPLLQALANTPTLFEAAFTELRVAKRFFSPFLQFLMYQDGQDLENALSLLSIFFFAIAHISVNPSKSRSVKVGKPLTKEGKAFLEDCIRRCLNTVSIAACKSRLGPKGLRILRQTVASMASIFHTVQVKAPGAVYEAFFLNLRKLINECARAFSTKMGGTKDPSQNGNTKSVKSLKKSKASSGNNVDVRSGWRVLFLSHIFSSVLMLENGGIGGRLSLARQVEGWSVLLSAHLRHSLSKSEKLPMAFKLVANLLSLMNASELHVPLGVALIRLGYQASTLMDSETARSAASLKDKHAKAGLHLLKNWDCNNLIAVSNSELINVRVYETFFDLFFSHVTAYLSSLSFHPAFVETSYLVQLHLKKVLKASRATEPKRKLKLLIDAIAATSAMISVERNKLDVSSLPEKLKIFPASFVSTTPLNALSRKHIDGLHYYAP